MAIDWSEAEVGLVLAGAVAQGAFGAGFVQSFARQRPRIVQIAGTSSGALNATLVAVGVAAGRLERAVDVLATLWVDHGSWRDIEHVQLGDLLHARGLFDTARLSRIVADGIAAILDGAQPGPPAADVRLTLVTTNLDGRERPDPPLGLPTYEQPVAFGAADLLDPAKRAAIANAAVASATFPGMFAPTKLIAANGAPCVDGGAVNNAPISYVIDDPRVRRVVVVTSEATVVEAAADFGGTALISRLANAIIDERITQDLHAAHRANERYAAVARALVASNASEATKKSVLEALDYRPIALFLVHPEPKLTGSAFSGFFDAALRRAYVAAGQRATIQPVGGDAVA